MTGKHGTIAQRFERNCMPEPNTGCWLWLGSLVSRGYGYLGVGNGRITRAHAVSFMLYRGTVPEGKQLHHACGIKSCVNPEHLIAVSPLEHKRAHKLHYCRSGRHILESRFCKKCSYERLVAWRKRKALHREAQE
jgi:hypothetical protein